MNFERLVQAISDVHRQLQTQAVKAVNIGLTLRNWLIGAYISEYELRGEDRAAYGAALYPKLSKQLKKRGLGRTDERELRRYNQFFLTYPQIRESLTPEFQKALPMPTMPIVESLTPESAPEFAIGEVATLSPHLQVQGRRLVDRLSFTHLALLMEVADPLKRIFYEIECIKGGWSVRELQRQIGSLYFERSGLSRDKEALSRMANDAAEAQTCLLYTSPSPRDRQKSRMPSSA